MHETLHCLCADRRGDNRNTGTRQIVRGGDNVILITLDGVRTEEVFGGLDVDILRSTLKGVQPRVEDSLAYDVFGHPIAKSVAAS